MINERGGAVFLRNKQKIKPKAKKMKKEKQKVRLKSDYHSKYKAMGNKNTVAMACL